MQTCRVDGRGRIDADVHRSPFKHIPFVCGDCLIREPGSQFVAYGLNMMRHIVLFTTFVQAATVRISQLVIAGIPVSYRQLGNTVLVWRHTHTRSGHHFRLNIQAVESCSIGIRRYNGRITSLVIDKIDTEIRHDDAHTHFSIILQGEGIDLSAADGIQISEYFQIPGFCSDGLLLLHLLQHSERLTIKIQPHSLYLHAKSFR